MKSKLTLVFTLLCGCLFAQPNLTLQSYVTGFSSPIDIANCGDERLFVVERAGTIRIIENGVRLTTPFLDIDSIVINGGGEQGLLGLAFHPDYKTNGFFFVYYVNNSGNLVIARYSVTSDPNIADAGSRTNVLTIPHPGETNHNGGNLDFGPDGYLYIATGDGGGGGDPGNNAQDPLELLGKMLRLDVDTLPYLFPPDNPYIGMASVRNEIWATGLRNPWRFSFDRMTGDLWIGDVGQGAQEEVNFQPASSAGGENYGWRCYEGNSTYNTNGCGAIGNYTFPVHDYPNPDSGCSVVGGYVYRGCRYPDLFGHYLYADYCSGRFWTLHHNGSNWVNTLLFDDQNFRYSAFGEDNNGDLYVAGLGNGIIYKVVEADAAALPMITVQGNTSFCPGDTAELSTNLAGFVSYEWLREDTVVATGMQVDATEAGDYALRVTGNNGCIYTTPATEITVYPVPAPLVGATSSTYCAGDSVLLSTGPFNSYAWSNGATSATTYVQQGSYSVTVTNANGCSGTSPDVTINENPLPEPEIQQTGTLCGLSFSVDLSTTVPFSSYLWSTNATSETIAVSQPGNYTVTVTDANGCTAVSPQYTVVVQSVLTPFLTSQNGTEICSGESTTIYLSESFTSYQWSTGATDSAITVNTADEYWVIVTDDFGCGGSSDTLDITVLTRPAPSVISQNGTVFCADASTELSLSGNYTAYTWSTGSTSASINVNASDSYWAVVSDNAGCTGSSDTLDITVNALPTPNIFQGDSVQQCGDGVIELFTDAPYASYEWSRGDTISILFVVSSGTFNVTVTDSNGCVGVSDSTVVGIYPNPPQPEINFIHGYFVTDTGYHYQWYINDTLLSDADTASIDIDECCSCCSQDVVVVITDENGCTSISDTLRFDWEGIEKMWLENFSIKPNPFSQEFVLEYVLKDMANLRVSIKDITGKEIAVLLDDKRGGGTHTLTINTAKYQLSKGFYFLEIANGVSRKVLKLEKM